MYQHPFRSNMPETQFIMSTFTEKACAHYSLMATQSIISCQELPVHPQSESLSVRVLSFRAMTACEDDKPQTHRVHHHTLAAIEVDVYEQKR